MVLACRVLGLLLAAPLVFVASHTALMWLQTMVLGFAGFLQLGEVVTRILQTAWNLEVPLIATVVVTGFALWGFWRISRYWSKKRAIIVCSSLALVAAGLAVAATLFWYAFMRPYADSDTEMVPREFVDGKLNEHLGCGLPAGAKNVQVLITTGFGTSRLYLKFEGEPEDLRQFVGRALRTPYLAGVQAQTGPSPDLSIRWPKKDWWTPRDDIPLWYRLKHDDDTFLQWDEANGVVYVMKSL